MVTAPWRDVSEHSLTTPVTVNMQFPFRWWAPLMTLAGVNVRLMGGGSCLSRTEMWNTPAVRDLNFIRSAYSDGHCAAIYAEFDRLPEPDRTNAAVRFVLGELRQVFPEFEIPAPIGYPWSGNSSDYIGFSFTLWRDGPWHWVHPGTATTQDSIAEFAQNPLGPQESLCLAGDAWDLVYSSWTTSAIRSSSACLERFFPGRSNEWKPESTQCCELRVATNATVDGGPWFNWNARYNVHGCGEENWAPGAAYLTHERWWPNFEEWQPTNAGSTTCALPKNPETGEVDTAFCHVDAGNYRYQNNNNNKKKKTEAQHPRKRPFHKNQ